MAGILCSSLAQTALHAQYTNTAPKKTTVTVYPVTNVNPLQVDGRAFGFACGSKDGDYTCYVAVER